MTTLQMRKLNCREVKWLLKVTESGSWSHRTAASPVWLQRQSPSPPPSDAVSPTVLGAGKPSGGMTGRENTPKKPLPGLEKI